MWSNAKRVNGLKQMGTFFKGPTARVAGGALKSAIQKVKDATPTLAALADAIEEQKKVIALRVFD